MGHLKIFQKNYEIRKAEIYMIDWLLTVLGPAQEFFTYVWRLRHCPRIAAKFRSMLGAQGL
jgi:hypothetical protein